MAGGMRFGRSKQPKQQPRTREVRPSGRVQPTFSYYANRLPSDTARLRSEQTLVAPSVGQKDKDSRSLLSLIGMWLSLALFVLLLGKLLALQTHSRVIISARNTSNVSSETLARYQATADDLLKGSILNRSKATIDTTGIAKAMQAQFPELESVVVTVPIVGARPIVYILPVQALISIETTKGTYSLGSNGRVIAKLTATQNDGVVVRDLSGVPPELGQPLLPASTMTFIQSLTYQFERAGQKIDALTLPAASPYEIDAHVTGRSYTIKFNLEEDAKQQSGAALGVIKQVGGSGPSQYIDVRVPERAYYK